MKGESMESNSPVVILEDFSTIRPFDESDINTLPVDCSMEGYVSALCKKYNNGEPIFPIKSFIEKHLFPHIKLVATPDYDRFVLQTLVWDDEGYIIDRTIKNSTKVAVLAIRFNSLAGGVESRNILNIKKATIRDVIVSFLFEEKVLAH